MSDLPLDDDARDESATEDAASDELLGTLRAAWRAQEVPPLQRELPDTDVATQRAVAWLAAAWRAPGVLEPSAQAAQRARFAVRRHSLPQTGRTSVRRQLAAAALLVALLTAALHLDRLLPTAARGTGAGPGSAAHGLPSPHPMPAVAVAPPPAAGQPSTPAHPSGSAQPPGPAPRAHARAPSLFAAAGSSSAAADAPAPPIELRSGSVRLLLFTDASLKVPERLP